MIGRKSVPDGYDAGSLVDPVPSWDHLVRLTALAENEVAAKSAWRMWSCIAGINLSCAQRKTVAELLPEFADRLQIGVAASRTIQFTLTELREIADKCRAAVATATGGMVRNSLRHVVDTTTKALDRYKESSILRIPTSQRLYQFKITLTGITPPIWRRIQVRECTLDKLHERIQTAMGWENCHLHQFKINGLIYGDPQLLDRRFEDDLEFIDSLDTRISEIVPEDGKRFRFEYEYDFGDCWEHEVLFEGCVRAEKGIRYPLCLEGERACPPEDVGGVSGYQEYLEGMADSDSERHQEFMEWRGPFDPVKFDEQTVTKRMRRGLPNWRNEDWL